MPAVNIPGVGRVNFPDGMSPEDIQRAIERDILGKQASPTREKSGQLLFPGDRGVSSAGEPISAQRQREMAISSARAEHPIAAKVQDIGSGMLGMTRGALNLLSRGIGNRLPPMPQDASAPQQGLGDRLLPQDFADKESGAYLAGQIADPLAWATGTKAAQLIPYKRVLGGGGINALKATAQNVAGGAIPGSIIAGLSEGGDARSGAALGASANVVLPPAISAVAKVATGSKNVLDLVLPGGARRIANRYQTAIVGEEQIPAVISALRSQADEFVKGSKPTAAQAVSQVPAASPLIAHQAVTSKTPGGISARFGERTLEQQNARRVAMETLEAKTAPMRQAAIDAANAGGVKASRVVDRINGLLKTPGWRASKVVKKTLEETRDKIKALAENGVIDANDLYTIRKELRNTISQFQQETKNWDKRLAAKLGRSIQLTIDDVIESSGGTEWKAYISEYAKGRQAITADIERAKLALRPIQRTSLSGGENVTDHVRTHIPQLLSRPAMIANAILRKLGYAIEPRVDAIMAERYLNPAALADALEAASKTQRAAILREMAKQRATTATIVAGSKTVGEE